MIRKFIHKEILCHWGAVSEIITNNGTVKENTKSCNSMFEFRSRQSLSKTQHCLSQDVSNKILLCYH